MKKQMCATQVALGVVLSLGLLASAVAAGDEWVCSSGCVVVDPSYRQVVSLGGVTGTSTFAGSEAWADLLQACANRAREEGYASGAQAVRSFRFDRRTTRESLNVSASSSEGWGATRSWLGALLHPSQARSAFGFSYQSEQVNGLSVTEDISVELVSPAPSECMHSATSEHGQPKYVGPGRPLG